MLIIGEFDPGSELTLAACITHASRTLLGGNSGKSGERVSNTWVIFHQVGNKLSKGSLIPHDAPGRKSSELKP